MIPAGYMAKRIARRGHWPKVPSVEDIYSVSHCLSPDFARYIEFWKHNGHWCFDSVSIIRDLAAEQSIDLAGCRFFFYEIHELEFIEETREWISFDPFEPVGTIVPPEARRLEGYDVVAMAFDTSPPGCSPLSCNGLAEKIPVNRHCLLESLDEAKRLLENGAFDNSEPGPFRIYAIHSFDEVA